MRCFLIIILGLFILLPLQSGAAEVRVGIDNNPPLTFVTADDQTTGLLPDLLTQIAKQEKWSLEFVSCQWQGCLEQLEAGNIDILPAIAFTEERAKKFRFARETVMTNWGQVYQQPGSKLESVLQLENLALAVLKEDIHYVGEYGIVKMARQFDIRINFVEVDSYREAFTLLHEKKVAAALVNRLFGLKNQRIFDLRPTPILLNPIQVRPAFSTLSNPLLVEQFDRQVKIWKENPDSIYYQLLNKWLTNGVSSKSPGWLIPFISVLGALLVLSVLTTLWIRRQVSLKTLLLKEKNFQLAAELITRQEIEQELLERQLQYQGFFEESQSIMLLVDPETATVVDANPAACKFYQYSRDQLQKMKMWQINQLEEDEVRKRLTAAKNQYQQQFERIHTLADGQKIPVDVYRSPIQAKGQTLLYSIIHDISKRKKAEQALEDRNHFLQSVIDGVSDPLMVIGLDYQVIQMNQAASGQLSSSADTLMGISCYQLSHASLVPCDGSDHPCPLLEIKKTGLPMTMIHQHTTDQGKRFFELCASPLFDTKGEVYAIIEVARDITERLQVEELLNENEKRLHHMAHHDALTNLPNRLLFEDRLKQALRKVSRNRRQVALFFLDIDHLKAVNDNLGHDYGDLLLIDVAKRLRQCVREGDTVARMGGDEFLVLLEDIESIEMIEAMAERICAALSHELSKGDFSQKISASIGISIYPEDAKDGQEMMKNADLAMYRVKKSGKANYQFYSAPQGRFLFD
ncbi:MAG: diguanylate cyclase [Desulfuromusa sp.]|nr:diguanylate cyclase [Desulfuromusa sp.]